MNGTERRTVDWPDGDQWIHVVEEHRTSGYLAGGSYINTFEHEIVGIYTDIALARKHARRKGCSLKTFKAMTEVPTRER